MTQYRDRRCVRAQFRDRRYVRTQYRDRRCVRTQFRDKILTFCSSEVLFSVTVDCFISKIINRKDEVLANNEYNNNVFRFIRLITFRPSLTPLIKVMNRKINGNEL